MSLFKKAALVGAISTVLFLGLAVGSVSADDDHDHHWHDNPCYNDATGTIDLSKCPMVLTNNGWFIYPNAFNNFSWPYIYNNPFYHYNFYNMYNPHTYNFGYPLYGNYPGYHINWWHPY